MVLLDYDTFLTKLTHMFHNARSHGSVILTMKRYDGKNKHTPKTLKKRPEPSEYMCLIRAKQSSNKISTVVHPKDVNKFQQAYCSLIRGNMDGLKKLKKAKIKAKAQ